MDYSPAEQYLPSTGDVIETHRARRFARQCLWPIRFIRRLHAEHRQALALEFAGPSERRDFDAAGIRPPYS